MTEMGHKEVKLPEEWVEEIAPLELDQMLQLQQYLNEAIAQAEKYKALLEEIASLELGQKLRLQQYLNEVVVEEEKEKKYGRLRELLAAEKWKEADQETEAIMLKLSNGGKPSFIHGKYLEKISCEDFEAIDQLWVEYSNGHFGFSVQKRIWQEVGGKPYDIQEYDSFSKAGDKFDHRVRWNWDDFQFSLDAPPGHLPSFKCVGVNGGIGNATERYHQSLLATKFVSCTFRS